MTFLSYHDFSKTAVWVFVALFEIVVQCELLRCSMSVVSQNAKFVLFIYLFSLQLLSPRHAISVEQAVSVFSCCAYLVNA
jgi:uncharacterized membrane protein